MWRRGGTGVGVGKEMEGLVPMLLQTVADVCQLLQVSVIACAFVTAIRLLPHDCGVAYQLQPLIPPPDPIRSPP